MCEETELFRNSKLKIRNFNVILQHDQINDNQGLDNTGGIFIGFMQRQREPGVEC